MTITELIIWQYNNYILGELQGIFILMEILKKFINVFPVYIPFLESLGFCVEKPLSLGSYS